MARLVAETTAWQAVMDHMHSDANEQLAFMLATWNGDIGRVFATRLIQASGLDSHLPWHIALSDNELAAVIKWAHENNGALVEVHAHRAHGPAQFSMSDRAGLEDFVPHVWWRLQHRPYVAVVVGNNSFDALVWQSSPAEPAALASLVVGGRGQEPTKLSIAHYR